MLYYSFGKRTTDIFLSASLLFFLLPFMVLVSVVLMFFSKDNPLFIQKRPGQNAEIFNIYKFRTMHTKGNKLLSMFCLFLRRYSIDEFPQLVNVLKGEMSMVGPRPLLEEYVPLFNQYQNRRHQVKPGITGLAQVEGRNSLSWQEKFDYDVWYVENLSVLLDFYIFLKSFQVLWSPVHVRETGLPEKEKFRGNQLKSLT